MGARFDGRVALVTGSSSGIGKAIALRLAREGADVAGAANRNAAGGEATSEEIRGLGRKSLFVQADVAVGADCQRAVEQTVAALGGLDILVNNAGITRATPLEKMDEALWDTVLDTNLKSAYLMSRAAVGPILARGGGSVVNIASVHAVATQPGHGAYAASKAGLIGLTHALALEFGARGIRFNCILPGTIDLGIYSRANPAADRAAWRPRASEVQPLKRLGSPDEIAAAVAFLVSDDASFLNGAAIPVDGGLLAILRDR